MSGLTVDMTRLCNEISAARGARETLTKNRETSIKNLKRGVTRMLAGFSNGHAQMARRSQADRLAFVSNLKHAVAGLRREVAADLSSTHRAWLGIVPAPVMPRDKADAERRARAEAERLARQEAEKRRLETEEKADAERSARAEAERRARQEAEKRRLETEEKAEETIDSSKKGRKKA